MPLSIIVAMDNNNTIGINNSLPWHLPEDLTYFKRVTSGNAIIMGRKTYESIGKPLPKRTNIILTRDKDYQVEGCIVCHSIEEVLDKVQGNAFVIGGKQIYQLFLPYVDKLYITRIYNEYEGDTTFDVNLEDWYLESKEKGIKNEKNNEDYEFLVYKKDTV